MAVGKVETEIKAKLKALRKTVADLCRESSIHRACLSGWLNGTYDMSEERVAKVAETIERWERASLVPVNSN